MTPNAIDKTPRNLVDIAADTYEAEQRLCDIAGKLMQALLEERLCVGDTLLVIEKMNQIVETSTQASHWNEPLVCKPAQNREHRLFYIEGVKAEVERRKNQENP